MKYFNISFEDMFKLGSQLPFTFYIEAFRKYTTFLLFEPKLMFMQIILLDILILLFGFIFQ